MTSRHVPRTRPFRTIRLIAALVTVTACGPKADPVVPPPTPTLAVTVAPATVTVAAGTSGTAQATFLRGGGLTGDVAVTSSGAPAGITVAFTPATVAAAATTSDIAVNVAANVAAGSYPVTIRGTVAGTGQVTGSTTLTVTVPVVTATTVTQTYCSTDTPIWFAYQDGTGPWTRVLPGANNTFSFQLQSARGGIATVNTVGGVATAFDVNVVYASAAEMATYSASAGIGACPTKNVTGTIAGVTNLQFTNISLGTSTTFVTGNGTAPFQLTRVPDGTLDLFAARIVSAGRRADRLILRRGVSVANGGTVPVVDFAAAESFAPATDNVRVLGLTTDTAIVSTVYTGVRSSTFGFLNIIPAYTASSGAVPYDAIPVTRLNAGELQQLYAVTSTPQSSRFAGVFFRAPGAFTVPLAGYLSTPTITRSTDAPYARPRFQVDFETAYSRLMSVEFAQASQTRTASLLATSGYTGGTRWDFVFPDLSAAAGWNSTWALRPAVPFTWTVTGYGGAIAQFDASIADGATFRIASNSSLQAVP